MKRRMLLVGVLVALLWATPARADNQFIVRSTLSLQALQTACNPPLLSSICTVVGGLGDPLGQLFLITSPLDLSRLLMDSSAARQGTQLRMPFLYFRIRLAQCQSRLALTIQSAHQN
jgi:hypothetical protein